MQTWEPETQTARFQTKWSSCLHWEEKYKIQKKEKNQTKTQKEHKITPKKQNHKPMEDYWR